MFSFYCNFNVFLYSILLVLARDFLVFKSPGWLLYIDRRKRQQNMRMTLSLASLQINNLAIFELLICAKKVYNLYSVREKYKMPWKLMFLSWPAGALH